MTSAGVVLFVVSIYAGADEDETPERNNEEEEAEGRAAIADDSIPGIHSSVQEDEGKIGQDDANAFHDGVLVVERGHNKKYCGKSNLAK